MVSIVYTRSSDSVSDGTANGRRGNIKIGGKSWHTIERLDGYKWVRPGTYEAEFGYWTSSSGKKSKAIRILGVYNNRIYFHPANKPSELKGCIAPGLSKIASGVGSSRNALRAIFDELGGFAAGKKLHLKIEGNINNSVVNSGIRPGENSGIGDLEPPDNELIA